MKRTLFIGAWRDRSGLKQADLAKAAGVSPAYISQIESGKKGGAPDVLKDIADALHIKVDDLYRMPDDATPVPPAPYRYPIRAIVRAGPVMEAVEIPESPIGWEPSLLPVEDHLDALEIAGDSMEPALAHGDRIVIDTREVPTDGDVVLAEYHDPRRPDEPPELTVKLYQRAGDAWHLVPLNPVYETRVFDPRWWRIRGVLVKVIQRNVRGRFRWLAGQEERHES